MQRLSRLPAFLLFSSPEVDFDAGKVLGLVAERAFHDHLGLLFQLSAAL